MILVDTSVWIDHFRADNPQLTALLDRGQVLCHPLVIGELATGHSRQRAVILAALHGLPKAAIALDKEVLRFIEQEHLFGLGLGYIDIHLLAATRLTPGALLWTKDRRLHDAAKRQSVAAGISETA